MGGHRPSSHNMSTRIPRAANTDKAASGPGNKLDWLNQAIKKRLGNLEDEAVAVEKARSIATAPKKPKLDPSIIILKSGPDSRKEDASASIKGHIVEPGTENRSAMFNGRGMVAQISKQDSGAVPRKRDKPIPKGPTVLRVDRLGALKGGPKGNGKPKGEHLRFGKGSGDFDPSKKPPKRYI